MPESEHEHSVLSEIQHQRVAALNTASACLGTRSSGLGGRSLAALPGDLIRVAQWIMDGQLIQTVSGGDSSVVRDKRSGFLTALSLEVGQAPADFDDEPTTGGALHPAFTANLFREDSDAR